MGRMLVLAAGVDVLRVKAEPPVDNEEVLAWANAHWRHGDGYEWEVQHRADGEGEVILRAVRKEAKRVEGDMDARGDDRADLAGEADCQGR